MRTFARTLGMALAAVTLARVTPPATAADIEETRITDDAPDVAANHDAGPGARVEKSLERAGEATNRGIEHGAEPVGRGLERAMKATGRGIRKAIEKTGEGLRRAGEALSGEGE